MRYLPLVIFLAFFVCCKKRSDPPRGVDGKLKFSFEYYYHDLNAPPYFYVEADTSCHCSGYQIDNKWDRQGTNCTITIEGLKKSTSCVIGSVAIGSVFHDINDLGTYTFTVVNGNKAASGTLNVMSDLVVASYPPNDVFSFRYDTIRKVPESSVWGSIGYRLPGYEDVLS
jgi:hypothetical protein